jgi:formylglycine-generating enzyme required for sulfatase activity
VRRALVVLFLMAGCGDGGGGPAILVDVTGLPPATTGARATFTLVDDGGARVGEPRVFRPTAGFRDGGGGTLATSFTVVLPGGGPRSLMLGIAALDGGDCVIARGETTVATAEKRATVAVAAVARDCSTPPEDSQVPDAAVPDSGVPDAAPADAAIGDMVLVPHGSGVMGCVTGGCSSHDLDHNVTLTRDFYIDRLEVTQVDYERCAVAGPCARPSSAYNPATTPMLPVVMAAWQDAVDYCAWAGKRLPTEAEWERAARGTTGLQYPWGTTAMFDCAHANTAACKPAMLRTVGGRSAGASPYGAEDMLGNVEEWVQDWDFSYDFSQADETDPTGPASGGGREIRGGSWVYPVEASVPTLRTWTRDYGAPASPTIDTGFRCARTR